MTKLQKSMIFVSAAAAGLFSVQAQASNTSNNAAAATAAAAAAGQARITVQAYPEGEEITVNGRSVTFCTQAELRGSYATRKACLSPERSRQLLRR